MLVFMWICRPSLPYVTRSIFNGSRRAWLKVSFLLVVSHLSSRNFSSLFKIQPLLYAEFYSLISLSNMLRLSRSRSQKIGISAMMLLFVHQSQSLLSGGCSATTLLLRRRHLPECTARGISKWKVNWYSLLSFMTAIFWFVRVIVVNQWIQGDNLMKSYYE